MIFTKIRNVKSPMRANATDAGIDLFVPEFDDDMITSLLAYNKSPTSLINRMDRILSIPANTGVIIPSGIKTIVDESRALIAFNKSGIASKFGLVLGACVIDSSFRGEILINLINTSTKSVDIYPGMKIVQLLDVPVGLSSPKEISNEEYSKFDNTSRGTGGFGSTGQF